MRCSKCNKHKDIDEFNKSSKPKSGFRSQCKSCDSEYARSYYKLNKERLLLQHRNYIALNVEKVRTQRRVYYNKHKDVIIKRSKQWSDKHKERCKGYVMKHYADNLNYRITLNLRNRVRYALKHNTKHGKTIELIGCNIEELKQHLESLFQSDMNWDNYGEWHIDHIIPCSKFELQYSEEQEVCFHWTNLQPLWEADNLNKGGRTIG